MLDEVPEGWYVPIQLSLTNPKRDAIGGVPFGFAVLLGTFTLAMVLGAQKLWVGVIGLVVYGLAVAACQFDPHFFDVVKEHIRSHSYYGV